MNWSRIAKAVILSGGSLIAVGSVNATILSVLTSTTSIGNHGANLVVNGSFENRAPGDPTVSTDVNWSGLQGSHTYSTIGTGSTAGAVYAVPGWSQTSSAGAYGVWGPFTGLSMNAPPCADGIACLYFGNYAMSTGAANPAIFHADGTVTFATVPVFNNIGTNNSSPTILFQTLNGLIAGDKYLLEFWAAGENSNGLLQSPGVFGLGIGADSVMLTVPTPNSKLLASSIRYGVTFTATAANEILSFTNWGHVAIGQGYGSELILDDVIVNRVPEPTGIMLVAIAISVMSIQRNRFGARLRQRRGAAS